MCWLEITIINMGAFQPGTEAALLTYTSDVVREVDVNQVVKSCMLVMYLDDVCNVICLI